METISTDQSDHENFMYAYEETQKVLNRGFEQYLIEIENRCNDNHDQVENGDFIPLAQIHLSHDYQNLSRNDDDEKKISFCNRRSNRRQPTFITPAICSTSGKFFQRRQTDDSTATFAFHLPHRSPSSTMAARNIDSSHYEQSPDIMNNTNDNNNTRRYLLAMNRERLLRERFLRQEIWENSGCVDDVYSTWNDGMSQVVSLKAYTRSVCESNEPGKKSSTFIWLDPPVAGLPGGWASGNVVNATNIALNYYLTENNLAGTSPSPLASSPTSTMEESKETVRDDGDEDDTESEEYDTMVQLTHLVLNGFVSAVASTKKAMLTHGLSHIRGSYHALFPNIHAISQAILAFGQSLPRVVCQHPFKRNEIVWVCRTCQSDETCVLCHFCFSHSNHEGHDVSFYHAQAGGCCDCGDPEAWCPKGFCHLHGSTASINSASEEVRKTNVESRCAGSVLACSEWLASEIARGADEAYAWANSERSYPTSFFEKRAKRPSNVPGACDTSTQDLEINRCTARRLQSFDVSASPSRMMRPLDTISGEKSSDNNVARAESDITDAVVSIDSIDSHSASSLDCNKAISFNPKAASASKSKSTATSCIRNYGDKTVGESSVPFIPPTFHPEAAGTSKYRNSGSDRFVASREAELSSPHYSALTLGLLGSEQQGLFLVLHSDDIHSIPEIAKALGLLYSSNITTGSLHLKYQSPHNHVFESLLSKIAHLLKTTGDLIVYGSHELMAELGPVLSQCWKDGDKVASFRFGALMMEKANILNQLGLVVSIKTRWQLFKELRAKAIINFLTLLSKSCDPLCLQVSLGLSGCCLKTVNSSDALQSFGCLIPMLRCDLKLPRNLIIEWHALLLLLLSVPTFKRELANSYCDTYSLVSSQYANGIGLQDNSSFILSVQFLNRATFVVSLVRDRDLIGVLCRCLLNILSCAIVKPRERVISDTSDLNQVDFGRPIDVRPWISTPTVRSPNAMTRQMDVFIQKHNDHFNTLMGYQFVPRLNVMHPVLLHKRYTPCISDFKYVLNVPGMSRLFASLPIDRDKMCYKQQRMGLSGLDDFLQSLALAQNMDEQVWRKMEEGHIETEPRDWIVAFNTSIALGSLFERLLNWEDDDPFPISDNEGLRRGTVLLSAVELTHYVLSGIMLEWIAAETTALVTTSNFEGFKLNNSSLPMSSVAWRYGTTLKMKFQPFVQNHPWSFHLPLFRFAAFCVKEIARRPYSHTDGFVTLFNKLNDSRGSKQMGELFSGIIEFIVLILSRTSQIKAGVWKRNGACMIDQVLNYNEPPFCRLFRDADLTLLQFSLLGLVYLHTTSHGESCSPCSVLIHLMIHRFGVFDFLGFSGAAQEGENVDRSEKISDTLAGSTEFDAATSLVMLDNMLHTLILLVTELPSPPVTRSHEVDHAQKRLRRELIHRLASGPKTHSELGEVIHVLSLRDNNILSDEGKKINPDDAVGSSIQAVLAEVASRVPVRGSLGPEEWKLNKAAWSEYDPAFFHMSPMNHQVANDNRSSLEIANSPISSKPQSYIPPPPPAYDSFCRLRKDITTDSCVVSIIYRILHAHCSCRSFPTRSRGKSLVCGTKSESLLSRVIQILTMGAFVWSDSSLQSKDNWRIDGGGDEGSVFYSFEKPPRVSDWIEKVLLSKPEELLNCDSYHGEESALIFLSRLAGVSITVEKLDIRDKALSVGALWLCDFACRNSAIASLTLGNSNMLHLEDSKMRNERTATKRMQEARERIMNKMKADIKKFASIVVEDGVADDLYDGALSNSLATSNSDLNHQARIECDQHNSIIQANSFPKHISLDNHLSPHNTSHLFREYPRCVICAEDVSSDNGRDSDQALTFCAFAQSSTVMLGGCTIPSSRRNSMDRFVGTHIALCGHAVHSSCCDSYLATLLQREDRSNDRLDGKRGEFKCPLCRQLSNCLVPFIDVTCNWLSLGQYEASHKKSRRSSQSFLSTTKWWAVRNDSKMCWDGRCSFLPSTEAKHEVVASWSTRKVDTYQHADCSRSPYRSHNTQLKPSESNIVLDRYETNRSSSDIDRAEAILTSDIWRRLVDTLAEISYRADLKRLGEKELQDDLGEYRHYLVEKNLSNPGYSQNSSEGSRYSRFLSNVTESQRRALSREKLIARLLGAVQTFSYTCCAESWELRHLATSAATKGLTGLSISDLKGKFGFHDLCVNNNVIILVGPGETDATQFFEGRLGKLRHLILAIMQAASAISLEIVQLTLGFPIPNNRLLYTTTTDDVRAPITYPILCSNVLTHISAAICAVCGNCIATSDKLAKDGRTLDVPTSDSQGDNVQACEHFVSLGLVAKILQVLLGCVLRVNPQKNVATEYNSLRSWEDNTFRVLFTVVSTNCDEGMFVLNDEWQRYCCRILLLALSHVINRDYRSNTHDTKADFDNDLWKEFLQACDLAKDSATQYLCDSLLILQLVMPQWSNRINLMKRTMESCQSEELFLQILYLLGIDSIDELLDSPLVAEIVHSWYESSMTKKDLTTTQLCFEPSSSHVRRFDWPLKRSVTTTCDQTATDSEEIVKSMGCLTHQCNSLPLFGLVLPNLFYANMCRPRIRSIPLSYTDLYAEVSELLPNCEQSAFCFVCGEVLNAGGFGECSKHAHICGGGSGIFFLLQDCISLLLYKEKAAYFHSPYVDSHGETHMSRGRPLNLALERYEALLSIYSGHLIRQQVISERSKSARQQILQNFY